MYQSKTYSSCDGWAGGKMYKSSISRDGTITKEQTNTHEKYAEYPFSSVLIHKHVISLFIINMFTSAQINWDVVIFKQGKPIAF